MDQSSPESEFFFLPAILWCLSLMMVDLPECIHREASRLTLITTRRKECVWICSTVPASGPIIPYLWTETPTVAFSKKCLWRIRGAAARSRPGRMLSPKSWSHFSHNRSISELSEKRHRNPPQTLNLMLQVTKALRPHVGRTLVGRGEMERFFPPIFPHI